jgi:FkbM family methyltransferase
MMAASTVIERIAVRQPAATKAVLWAIARGYMMFPRKRHWLFDKLAADLDYLVPVTARLGNGMKMRVPWNDEVGRAIYETGWYEPSTVRTVASLLRPAMVFIDVGANIGQYTLLASKLVGPPGAVHSFEPSPTMFSWLSRNVRANGGRNIHLNRLALGDREKTATLYLSTPENTGATSMNQQYNFSGKRTDVHCITLDSYLAQHGIMSVDVMKVDVEGAELEVLIGAEKLLTGPNAPHLVVEFQESNQARFGSSCAKLAAFLTDRGYKLMTIQPPEPHDVDRFGAYTLNVLAIPEQSRRMPEDYPK